MAADSADYARLVFSGMAMGKETIGFEVCLAVLLTVGAYHGGLSAGCPLNVVLPFFDCNTPTLRYV
jgi:hypothetical protein